MADDLNAAFVQLVGYEQAPLKYPKLADATTPLLRELPGVLELLNESSRSNIRLQPIADQLQAPVDELRAASVFYIKQVLFSDHADYYRTLGLSHEASPEDIRRHYRLLIALFHPDKNANGAIWDELYASRINEAYNTLKRPEKRKVYDRQDRPVASQAYDGSEKSVYTGSLRDPRAAIRPTMPLLSRLYGSHLWQRHPKAVVLGGLGVGFLSAFLIVALSTSHPSLEIVESMPVPNIDDAGSLVSPTDERRDAFMLAIRKNVSPNEEPQRRNTIESSESSVVDDPDLQAGEELLLERIESRLASRQPAQTSDDSVKIIQPVLDEASLAAPSTSRLPRGQGDSSISAFSQSEQADQAFINSSRLAGDLAVSKLMAENDQQLESEHRSELETAIGSAPETTQYRVIEPQIQLPEQITDESLLSAPYAVKGDEDIFSVKETAKQNSGVILPIKAEVDDVKSGKNKPLPAVRAEFGKQTAQIRKPAEGGGPCPSQKN